MFITGIILASVPEGLMLTIYIICGQLATRVYKQKRLLTKNLESAYLVGSTSCVIFKISKQEAPKDRLYERRLNMAGIKTILISDDGIAEPDHVVREPHNEFNRLLT